MTTTTKTKATRMASKFRREFQRVDAMLFGRLVAGEVTEQEYQAARERVRKAYAAASR
jgi:uncharacterized membrane protein